LIELLKKSDKPHLCLLTLVPRPLGAGGRSRRSVAGRHRRGLGLLLGEPLEAPVDVAEAGLSLGASGLLLVVVLLVDLLLLVVGPVPVPVLLHRVHGLEDLGPTEETVAAPRRGAVLVVGRLDRIGDRADHRHVRDIGAESGRDKSW
jgi:hypothetical protein